MNSRERRTNDRRNEMRRGESRRMGARRSADANDEFLLPDVDSPTQYDGTQDLPVRKGILTTRDWIIGACAPLLVVLGIVLERYVL